MLEFFVKYIKLIVFERSNTLFF